MDSALMPKPEGHLHSLTHAERCAAFGSFTFTPSPLPDNPEHVTIEPEWLRKNLTTVEVPQIKRKVQFHRLAANDLLKLFAAWEDAGLLPLVLRFNGGFASRFKRGTSDTSAKGLSNHAWGTAIDVNAKWNPLGKEPAALGQPGCVLPLVPVAERLGWAWGGYFSRKDGMHFERASVGILGEG